MNSIDIIKQELINQKTLLDSKGFIVNTQGKYPSPSEITNTLNNLELNYDFTQATATEADVLSGKTFFAGTSDLRTGTFDTNVIEDLTHKLNCLVTGVGRCEIYIPEDPDLKYIREYCYSAYNGNTTLFYKHNLTIPSNIKKVGMRAFYKANLTGKLTTPPTCTLIDSGAFQYSTVEEAYLGGGSTSSSSYIFSECQQLKKVVIGEGITTLGSYAFAYNKAMDEVCFPTTLVTISSTIFYDCKNLKRVKFSRLTPATLNTGVFNECRTTIMLVPYQSYHKYFTATNYQKYSNPMYGWGDFAEGDTLPTADNDGLYTISWFASLDDLSAGTNPITISPSNTTLYGLFTALPTGETE